MPSQETPESSKKSDSQRPVGPGKALPRTWQAEELLQGEKQVVIQHAGEEYRLIVTKNNRLLLQK